MTPLHNPQRLLPPLSCSLSGIPVTCSPTITLNTIRSAAALKRHQPTTATTQRRRRQWVQPFLSLFQYLCFDTADDGLWDFIDGLLTAASRLTKCIQQGINGKVATLPCARLLSLLFHALVIVSMLSDLTRARRNHGFCHHSTH